ARHAALVGSAGDADARAVFTFARAAHLRARAHRHRAGLLEALAGRARLCRRARVRARAAIRIIGRQVDARAGAGALGALTGGTGRRAATAAEGEQQGSEGGPNEGAHEGWAQLTQKSSVSGRPRSPRRRSMPPR